MYKISIIFIFITSILTCSTYSYDELAFLDKPVMAPAEDINKFFKEDVYLNNWDLNLSGALKIRIFPHFDNRAPHRKDTNRFHVVLQSSTKFAVKINDEVLCYTRELKINKKNIYNKKAYCKDNKQVIDFPSSGAINVEQISSEPIRVIRVEKENNYFYHGKLNIFSKKNNILVVNETDMETYLRGVIPAEIFYSWPSETVKAQSVAARTYAWYHFKILLNTTIKYYHFDDTTSYQVYIGDYRKFKEVQKDKLLKKLEDVIDESKRIELQKRLIIILKTLDSLDDFFEAIKTTEYQVMTTIREGREGLFQAYFHASSGGATAKASDFEFSDCRPCMPVEDYTREDIENDEFAKEILLPIEFWEKTRTLKNILYRLKKSSLIKKTDKIKGILLPVEGEFYPYKTAQGHYRKGPIKLLNGVLKIVNGYPFKSSMGLMNVRYNILLNSNGSYTFQGRGWGHSIGLCQWGAYFKGKKNISYDQILKYYYQGINLITLPH